MIKENEKTRIVLLIDKNVLEPTPPLSGQFFWPVNRKLFFRRKE
jgi:hypothetical protein